MVIRKINERWWRLDSEGGEQGKLVWFAQSKEEVMHKFKAWVRENDLRLIRYIPLR